MITKNPAEPLPPASSSSDVQAPVLDPRSPIEVASTGDGTVNDPTAKDNRPPGVSYDDLSRLA